MDYISLNRTERKLFLELCHNERCINELGITYRMHRYCKWYRNLQKEPSENNSSPLSVVNQDPQQNTDNPQDFAKRHFFLKEQKA